MVFFTFYKPRPQKVQKKREKKKKFNLFMHRHEFLACQNVVYYRQWIMTKKKPPIKNGRELVKVHREQEEKIKKPVSKNLWASRVKSKSQRGGGLNYVRSRK